MKSGRHATTGGSSRKNETVSESLTCGEETVVGCRGKLLIRCNAPLMLEEMLRDVASKVDVVFDKVSRGEEEEILKLKSAGDESVEELKEPQDIRLLDK